MNSFSLPNALGGTSAANALEIDSLLLVTIGLVAAALIVLVAIAVSNWRAAKTLKVAREHWAGISAGRLAGAGIVRPNPMRKEP